MTKGTDDTSLRNRKKGKGKSNSPKKDNTKDEVEEKIEVSTSQSTETKNESSDAVATTETSSTTNSSKFTFSSLFENRGPGKGDIWSDIILLLYLYFAVIHISAALVNHIDDTDETYGYWEPLHYLLFKEGMQTWEYSPHYAIRSYAFIYPLYLIGKGLQLIGLHKLRIFYFLRLLIGLFTATGEVSFISAITRRYSNLILSFFVTFFLICSPGVYFASTSFLPSAIASSLIMHCVSCWIQMKFHWAIFWGSLAVLWTGWPFVGLLLLPIGIHMITTIVLKRQKRNPAVSETIIALVQFIVTSLMVVFFVFIPSLVLDVQSYGKWTSPTLNIAMYNVFNGSGDNLYGIEPVSYYIKNLFLNLGLAWPVALAWPLIAIMNKLSHKQDSTTKIELMDGFSVTILFAALLWLAVLFSRPHKEERFMYPVYPLICFIAALSVVHLSDILSKFAVTKLRIKPDSLKQLTFIIGSLTFMIALSLFVSRTSANYRNYSGYMKLWQDVGLFLEFDSSAANRTNTVCVGGEWHIFPSHFFLPANAKLEYVEDGFKGILPQHYSSENGTFTEPPQPFNDRNEEEQSRYVKLTQCDFYVGSTLPETAIAKAAEELKVEVKLEPVFSERFVSAAIEGWAIGKAYYIPIDPTEFKVLVWKDYSFFQVNATKIEGSE